MWLDVVDLRIFDEVAIIATPHKPSPRRFPSNTLDMNTAIQRRITSFVSGRVQGVGFRFHTKEVAKKFAVMGTVENLADGRVKIVAEGSIDEVHRFLDAVQNPMAGNVSKMERFESEASLEFSSFTPLW